MLAVGTPHRILPMFSPMFLPYRAYHSSSASLVSFLTLFPTCLPYLFSLGKVSFAFFPVFALFPTCQVRVTRFYQSDAGASPSSPLSPASSSSWALPDLICELQIAVRNAGAQPRAPDRSGRRRTSTASARSQWATPDLNGELR